MPMVQVEAIEKVVEPEMLQLKSGLKGTWMAGDLVCTWLTANASLEKSRLRPATQEFCFHLLSDGTVGSRRLWPMLFRPVPYPVDWINYRDPSIILNSKKSAGMIPCPRLPDFSHS